MEESHRGQGIAKTLFKYLGQICVEKDLARMDWASLLGSLLRVRRFESANAEFVEQVVLDWNTGGFAGCWERGDGS